MGFIAGSTDPNDPYAQPQKPAAPAPVAAAPLDPSKISTRANFEWGHGTASPGSTVGWTPQQWQDYETRQGLTYQDPNAPAAPAGNLGGDTVNTPVSGNPAPQTAGQAVTQQGTVGANPAQGSQSNVAGAFQQVLLNKLAPGQVDASNPNIAPAIQANQGAQQRASERLRMQNAERNAAQGTSMSGGSNTEQIGVEQDRALNEGQFNANAILGESDKQRQQQSQMASIVAGLLGQQDTLGMQKYGIDTDAALRREGLGATTALGQGDLDLRKYLGTGNLNLGLLQALMGDENFKIGESGTNARFSSSLNQEAILRGLGLL